MAASTVTAGSIGSTIASEVAPCHASSAKYTSGKLASSVQRVWPGPVIARTTARLRPANARMTPGHCIAHSSCCSRSTWSAPATPGPAGAAAMAKPLRNAGRSRTLSGVAITKAAIAASTTVTARETRELSSLRVIQTATSGMTIAIAPA